MLLHKCFTAGCLLVITYLSPGALAGVLTVTSDPAFFEVENGEEKEKILILNLAPPVGPEDATRTINFSCVATPTNGEITEYLWTFGENTVPKNSTKQNPGAVKFPSEMFDQITTVTVGVTHKVGEVTCASKDNPVATIKCVPVVFVTPAGDPVNSPVDAGENVNAIPDGANEFTFSKDEDPTVANLTIKLKAKIPGIASLPVEVQKKFVFEVDTIGNSRFAWDEANAGGKPTIAGDFITATAIFTRLPLNNTDFGKKAARVKCGSVVATQAEFEVFYPAFVSNFPRTSDIENWFYYYDQNAGGGDYEYSFDIDVRGKCNWGAGEGSIEIGRAAVTKNNYLTTKIENGRLTRTGSSETIKGYASFIGVLEHEREHALRQGSSAANDPDGDHLSNSYEENTSKTDPANPNSANPNAFPGDKGPLFEDDEVYAGGPVEENAYKGADTSQDWANPGTNFGPKP